MGGFEDQFGIEEASDELATLLGTETGIPLLKVTETVLDLSSSMVYVNLQYIATDRSPMPWARASAERSAFTNG